MDIYIRNSLRVYSLVFLLFGCGYVQDVFKKPASDEYQATIQDVLAAQDKRQAEYDASAGIGGWILDSDCDGALWSYTAATAACPPYFDPRASEFEGEPGRYGRKSAPPRCWPKQPPHPTSETTWSGDHGKGLIAYAIVCNDLALLEDHAAYGFNNGWFMGEGEEGELLARAYYRPTMRGELYKAIHVLGGENDAQALWPSVYPLGQTDFHAHLQVMSIWYRGEIAERLGEADAVPKPPEDDLSLTQISGTMFERLKEHTLRDPKDPLFSVLYAVYFGDYEKAIAQCAKSYAPDEYVGEYVRCNNYRACQQSHLLFACGILIRELI